MLPLLRVQYWQNRWETGQSQWHSEKPHKYLVKVRKVIQVLKPLVASGTVKSEKPHRYLVKVSKGIQVLKP